jgi:EmrB/QacA subfamily drug resistance transporter
MSVLGARRWWALGAITLAVLAVGLDLTVLSLALPTLAGALKATESDLQWFSSGYALVLAAGMLPAGLLGDRYGRKKVLLVSLALFAAGSVACAESRTAAEFLVARLALGLAGAGIVVMAISAIAVLFSEQERPRAIGVWGAANFLAFPIGPILGGWLLTHFWWGWVFLLNVPVAAVGFAAVVALVPETRAQTRPGIDWLGVLASSGGLAVVTYGLIEAGQSGWGDATALLAIAAGLLVLVGFFGWERHFAARPDGQPLVDPALFSSASFTWGVVLLTIMTLAMIGILFTMPQYFRAVLGATAQGSGLRLLSLVAGLLAGAVPTARLARRVGAKLTAAAGFAVLACGLALGSRMTLGSHDGFVALWMAIAGAGVGITLLTTASAALSELSADRAGIGSGVLQALKNVGAPLGAAVLGSVLSSGYRAHLDLTGVPGPAVGAVRGSVFAGLAVASRLDSAALAHTVRHAFVAGVDGSLLASVAFALAGVSLALAFMPGRKTDRRAVAATGAAGVGAAGSPPTPGSRTADRPAAGIAGPQQELTLTIGHKPARTRRRSAG